MANENITIGIDIQSNTSKEATQAERLGAALKDAASSAQKIKVPVSAGSAPATTGVRSVMQKSQPVGAQAMVAYGQQRGTAGATGAEARDFARQSEGLSGLVRLYAIYAANVYAAGAAFRALSEAMDTANMVKGLNQLGAQSGVALGSLSKQLAQTTGNAISLREAMEATAKSTAAGLSSQNVLRLGSAAAKASQALGVDITDAVSRLSRGITKLEPELLDELGIFVRIDEVTTKYAQSVGKTANSLTDFERRQAFANAVLDQAEKKFGSIKIDANPFNKLLATVKDLSQNILELINTAVGPLVNLLASSPTALLGILGMLGTSLIKKAVPAVLEFRKGLEQTAKDSAASAAARAAEAVAIQKAINKEITDLEAEAADARVEAVNKAENKILSLRTNGLNNAKSIYRLLEETQDITKISDTRFKRTEKVISGREAQGKISREEADAAREAISTLKDAKTAALNFADTGPKLRQNLEDMKNGWGTLGQTIRISAAAHRKATSDMIVSNAANTASTLGLTTGFKVLQGQIKTENITGLSKAFTYLKGSMAIVGGAAATLLGALGPILEIINLVVTSAGLLYGALTNTAEQSKATATALDSFKDSANNIDATLTAISQKPVLDQFNPQSVSAKANAVAGLADSLRKVFETSKAELKAMAGIDIAVDLVKMLWGGDVQSRLERTISTGIAKAFKVAGTNSAASKTASDSIKKLLGTTNVNLNSIESIQKALGNLSSSDKAAAIDKITQAIQELGKESQVSAAKTAELVDSFAKVAESRRKVQNEFVPKDTFSEYGLNLIDTFFKLDKALQDPEQKLNGIILLSKELGTLPVPRDLVIAMEGVAKQAEELQYVTGELQTLDNEIERLQGLTRGKEVIIGVKSKQIEGKSVKEITDEIEKLQQRKESLGDVRINLITSIQSEQRKVDQAAMAVYETGSQVVSTRLAAEWAKAGATVSTAIASLLEGTKSGVKMRADAERAVISAQIAQIKSQQALIIATEENTIARERATIIEEKARLEFLGKELPAESQTRLGQLDARQAQVDKYRGGKTTVISGKDFAGGVEKMAAMSQEATNFRLSMEGSNAQIAQLGAQLQAISIRELGENTRIDFERDKKALENRQSILQKDQQRFNASKELNSELSKSGLLAKQELEMSAMRLAFDVQQFDLALKIKLAEESLARTKDKDARKRTLADIEVFKTQQNGLKTNQRLEESNKKLADIKEQITTDAKIAAQIENDRFTAETRSFNNRTQQLDNDLKSLEYKKAAGILTEKDYLLQKGILDNSQISLTREREIAAARKEQTLALNEQDAAEKRLNEDKKARQARDRQQIDDLKKSGELKGEGPAVVQTTDAEAQAQKLIDEQRARINSSYSTTVSLADQVYQSSAKNLQQQQSLALYQDAWNTELARSQVLADSLAGSFGKVGSAIGGGIMAIKNLNKGQLEYNSKIKEQKSLAEKAFASAEAYDMTGDSEAATRQREKGNEALERAGELEKDRRQDELAGNAKSLSSLKTMFKEKSAGYKAIGAIEKAMHIASLAMNAQKMISEGITMVTSIGASMAKAGAAGLNAIMQAFAAPFPVGFIAGAAMAAIIGKLLGKAFGAKTSFMPSKEQRQETQGTAMGFDKEGNKIQVRTGVLGAPDQKTESISKSIDILAKNSEFSLDYSDKLLRSFEKLSVSIERAVANIAGVKGLTRGNIGDITEGTERSFLGFSRTVTTINDSGIKLRGTLDEIVNAGRGVVGGFADVTEQSSSFWGLFKDTDRAVRDVGLDPTTEKLVRGTIAQVYQTGLELGKKGGMTEAETRSKIGGIDVTQLISLRDLKGDDLEKAYSTAMSQIYDDIAETLYGPIIKNYGKILEAPGDAATRILDSNEKINVALRQTDPSLKLRTLGFDVTEAITDSFGGLDKFLSSISKWNDTFLTDQEKDANRRDKVGRLLQKYNITDLKDKETYIKIVRTMIENNEMNTDKFREFMEAGEDIDQIFSSLTETIKESTDKLQTAYDKLAGARDTLKDIVKTMKDFKESLLTGDKSVLTPGEKYLQTKSRFETTRDLAMSGNLEAIKELPNVSNAFLDASRIMFASSEQYVSDFNTVSASIDSITAFSEGMLTDAEKALEVARGSYSELEKISLNTDLSRTTLNSMLKELEAAKQARDFAGSSSITSAAAGNTAPVLATVSAASNPTSYSAITSSYTAGPTTGSGSILNVQPEAATWFNGNSWYMETAATGSNYIPEDMPLYVHQGERLMPAADNKQLMKMVNEYSGGGGELYQEVCRLTKQVETLTKVVADGAIINAEATDRNTDELAKTLQEASEKAAYASKLQNRTSIV